jgi:predicted acylesterase/phospholipase RssA
MRARLLGALGASLGCLFACNLVASRRLATAFNQGVLDSTPDPAYPRSKRAVDTVKWRMRDELGEGYFEQGERNALVVRWLDKLHDHADAFVGAMIRNSFDGDAGTDLPPIDEDAGEVEKCASTRQQRMEQALDRDVPDIAPPDATLCDGDQPNRAAIEQLADYVRFRVALGSAIDVTSKLVDERFATLGEAIDGARQAFGDTSEYLKDRRWKRDFDHRVTGLVVKGGAATGIFSAGVVWVTLNLIDQCIKAGKCDPAHAGFAMASGTSTGATIVTATDVFHTRLATAKGRADALHNYLDWYLCSSMNDLYCVRKHTAFDLARGDGAHARDIEDSLLDFDGLASKIEDHYKCPEMENGMELILNTVDFRTGRLYSLSDQDPATLLSRWDVAKAVVSSAALPFIVRPTYHLPVDPMRDAGNFAYLDGGIRSELPLLALVRRGVERLLVVSSAASVSGDDVPIHNALDMAIRYIDVSTGGVTEAEIDHARARAEASRLAEYELCLSMLRHDRMTKIRAQKTPLCTGHCDEDYLCSGDFARACSRTHGHAYQNNEQIVSQTFRVTNVWRNEDRVPGLPGYAFNPTEQRRLMLAGAEAARDQCRQIAATLGIQVDDATLFRWCTPRLPTVDEQCPADVIARLKKSPDAPDCPNDDGPKPADPTSTNSCGVSR